MWGKRLLAGALAAGMLAGGTACSSHPYEMAGDVAPDNSIIVHVRNQNFLDVDVYAVSEGLATRLGTVTGNTDHNFVVSAGMATQDFRIVATPVGGNGRATTGAISVGAGQTVDFTVGSSMRNSTVYIR